MTSFWLGSLQSYHDFRLAYDRAQAAMLSGINEPDDTSGLSQSGPVSVLNINGPLSNSTGFMAWLMGYASYPTIRNDLISAAQDKNTKVILLNIDSPGGSPAGLADTGKLIRHIDQNIKPVYAYTGGSMTSAAYWLGSAARQVYASPTAEVGSIGTVATHFDRSKQLEQDGVSATVFRDGPNKALGGPYEPLDDNAKETFQTAVAQLTSVFIDTVAEHRGTTRQQALKMAAGGRSYIGQEAVDIGLANSVTGLDELVTNLHKQYRQQEGGMGTKTRLMTPTAAALVMEGVPLESALSATEGQTEEGTQVEAQLSAPTAPAEGEPNAELEALQSRVTALESDLTQKDQEVTRLMGELTTAQTKLRSIETNHGKFREIAATSIRNMQVGLASPVLDTSGYPDEAVLQLHSSLSATFAATLPVGGVVPTMLAESDVQEEAQPRRRLHSVRL